MVSSIVRFTSEIYGFFCYRDVFFVVLLEHQTASVLASDQNNDKPPREKMWEAVPYRSRTLLYLSLLPNVQKNCLP